MATVEKIRRDIEKTKEKISEQQKRLRALEAQLTEEENLEICLLYTSSSPATLPPTAARRKVSSRTCKAGTSGCST